MISKATKCFLDMDGVLTDFNRAMANALEKKLPDPWPAGEDCMTALNVPEDVFWWHCGYYAFWHGMPWMPDGKIILDICEQAFGKRNVYICTSPTTDGQSARGKMSWLRANMPYYSRRFLITPVKEAAANPQTVLVDDSLKNVMAFTQAGGKGVLVPRAWNEAHGHADEAISRITLELTKHAGIRTA